MAINSIGSGIAPPVQNGAGAPVQPQINQAATEANAPRSGAATPPDIAAPAADGGQNAATSPAVPVVPATPGLVAPQTIAQAQESADSTDDARALDSEERVETAARERQEKTSENRERLNANATAGAENIGNAGTPGTPAGSGAAAPAALPPSATGGAGTRTAAEEQQNNEGQTTTSSAVDSPRERNPLNLLI